MNYTKESHISEHDKWKEDFLLELCQFNNPDKIMLDTNTYKLVGVPFYSPEKGMTNTTEKLDEIAKN